MRQQYSLTKMFATKFYPKMILISNIYNKKKGPFIRPTKEPSDKKYGFVRFFIDYRKVNLIKKKNAYPLPHIDDNILSALGGEKYFTILDLQSGYCQVVLDDKCKGITAFSTTGVHWEFNAMPFGLSNAPATF